MNVLVFWDLTQYFMFHCWFLPENITLPENYSARGLVRIYQTTDCESRYYCIDPRVSAIFSNIELLLQTVSHVFHIVMHVEHKINARTQYNSCCF